MLGIEFIEEYREKTKDLNKLKKEVKDMRLYIIEYMESLGKDVEVVGDYIVSIRKSRYKDIKDGKLSEFLNYLKENNLEDIVFETYSKTKLTDSINKGVLDLDDVKEYLNIRIENSLIIKDTCK